MANYRRKYGQSYRQFADNEVKNACKIGIETIHELLDFNQNDYIEENRAEYLDVLKAMQKALARINGNIYYREVISGR